MVIARRAVATPLSSRCSTSKERPPMRLARHFLAPALIVVLAAACGESDPDPTPTGSTCPGGSTLTYESFGRPFMESYCTQCHSSELHGDDRHGAPLYHDFDTLDGILVVADHIDEYAAAGPDAVNELMPESGDKPTLEERQDLGRWLACELAARDAVAGPSGRR
jgi:hypothetical protein